MRAATSPNSFAFVMATGIVAHDAELAGLPAVGLALLAYSLASVWRCSDLTERRTLNC